METKRHRRSRKKKKKGKMLFVLALIMILIYAGLHSCMDIMNEYSEAQLIKKGYPESLAELYVRNEEARGFVMDYKDHHEKPEDIDISGEVSHGEIPLFLQWDKRWGYQFYGDDYLAVTGCGPTALSMVYCGLTGDISMHPLAMAEFADSKGYYVNGSGSAWNMMTDLAEEIGLEVISIDFNRDSILQELRAGHPIICVVGPGDFTTSGHFIVLVSVDEGGSVKVHDPNSRKNSREEWEIDKIMGQTRALWGYDYK